MGRGKGRATAKLGTDGGLKQNTHCGRERYIYMSVRYYIYIYVYAYIYILYNYIYICIMLKLMFQMF
jgi:hypothetical protein